MGDLSPREIVIGNIECRATGRIGMNFPAPAGRIDDFAMTGCRDDIPTRRWEDGRFECYTDIWGNTWHRVKGMSAGGEVAVPALADWDDLDRLVLPNLDRPEYFAEAQELGRTENLRFRLAGMPGWPFAICRYMRKMDNYLMDLVSERKNLTILHDRVTDVLEKVIDQFGAAGVDGIIFCEDLGVQDRTLMSLPTWRQVFRPLYERLISRAHRHGMKVIQHSCGYNWLLIDDLCESGIDCLQFDQPTLYDMPSLAEKLRRHRVGLFSPCDIQRVLPSGNREWIVSETARLVRTFRGGFIAKSYGDLKGIGVSPESDQWAYEAFIQEGCV